MIINFYYYVVITKSASHHSTLTFINKAQKVHPTYQFSLLVSLLKPSVQLQVKNLIDWHYLLQRQVWYEAKVNKKMYTVQTQPDNFMWAPQLTMIICYINFYNL